jgi:hypothetical protein
VAVLFLPVAAVAVAFFAAGLVPSFGVAAFGAVAFLVAGAARLPAGFLADDVVAAVVLAGAAFVAGVVVAPVFADAFLGAAMWSSVTGAFHLDKCR